MIQQPLSLDSEKSKAKRLITSSMVTSVGYIDYDDQVENFTEFPGSNVHQSYFYKTSIGGFMNNASAVENMEITNATVNTHWTSDPSEPNTLPPKPSHKEWLNGGIVDDAIEANRQITDIVEFTGDIYNYTYSKIYPPKPWFVELSDRLSDWESEIAKRNKVNQKISFNKQKESNKIFDFYTYSIDNSYLSKLYDKMHDAFENVIHYSNESDDIVRSFNEFALDITSSAIVFENMNETEINTIPVTISNNQTYSTSPINVYLKTLTLSNNDLFFKTSENIQFDYDGNIHFNNLEVGTITAYSSKNPDIHKTIQVKPECVAFIPGEYEIHGNKIGNVDIYLTTEPKYNDNMSVNGLTYVVPASFGVYTGSQIVDVKKEINPNSKFGCAICRKTIKEIIVDDNRVNREMSNLSSMSASIYDKVKNEKDILRNIAIVNLSIIDKYHIKLDIEIPKTVFEDNKSEEFVFIITEYGETTIEDIYFKTKIIPHNRKPDGLITNVIKQKNIPQPLQIKIKDDYYPFVDFGKTGAILEANSVYDICVNSEEFILSSVNIMPAQNSNSPIIPKCKLLLEDQNKGKLIVTGSGSFVIKYSLFEKVSGKLYNYSDSFSVTRKGICHDDSLLDIEFTNEDNLATLTIKLNDEKVLSPVSIIAQYNSFYSDKQNSIGENNVKIYNPKYKYTKEVWATINIEHENIPEKLIPIRVYWINYDNTMFYKDIVIGQMMARGMVDWHGNEYIKDLSQPIYSVEKETKISPKIIVSFGLSDVPYTEYNHAKIDVEDGKVGLIRPSLLSMYENITLTHTQIKNIDRIDKQVRTEYTKNRDALTGLRVETIIDHEISRYLSTQGITPTVRSTLYPKTLEDVERYRENATPIKESAVDFVFYSIKNDTDKLKAWNIIPSITIDNPSINYSIENLYGVTRNGQSFDTNQKNYEISIDKNKLFDTSLKESYFEVKVSNNDKLFIGIKLVPYNIVNKGKMETVYLIDNNSISINGYIDGHEVVTKYYNNCHREPKFGSISVIDNTEPFSIVMGVLGSRKRIKVSFMIDTYNIVNDDILVDEKPFGSVNIPKGYSMLYPVDADYFIGNNSEFTEEGGEVWMNYKTIKSMIDAKLDIMYNISKESPITSITGNVKTKTIEDTETFIGTSIPYTVPYNATFTDNDEENRVALVDCGKDKYIVKYIIDVTDDKKYDEINSSVIKSDVIIPSNMTSRRLSHNIYNTLFSYATTLSVAHDYNYTICFDYDKILSRYNQANPKHEIKKELIDKYKKYQINVETQFGEALTTEKSPKMTVFDINNEKYVCPAPYSYMITKIFTEASDDLHSTLPTVDDPKIKELQNLYLKKLDEITVNIFVCAKNRLIRIEKDVYITESFDFCYDTYYAKYGHINGLVITDKNNNPLLSFLVEAQFEELTKANVLLRRLYGIPILFFDDARSEVKGNGDYDNLLPTFEFYRDTLKLVSDYDRSKIGNMSTLTYSELLENASVLSVFDNKYPTLGKLEEDIETSDTNNEPDDQYIGEIASKKPTEAPSEEPSETPASEEITEETYDNDNKKVALDSDFSKRFENICYPSCIYNKNIYHNFNVSCDTNVDIEDFFLNVGNRVIMTETETLGLENEKIINFIPSSIEFLGYMMYFLNLAYLKKMNWNEMTDTEDIAFYFILLDRLSNNSESFKQFKENILNNVNLEHSKDVYLFNNDELIGSVDYVEFFEKYYDTIVKFWNDRIHVYETLENVLKEYDKNLTISELANKYLDNVDPYNKTKRDKINFILTEKEENRCGEETYASSQINNRIWDNTSMYYIWKNIFEIIFENIIDVSVINDAILRDIYNYGFYPIMDVPRMTEDNIYIPHKIDMNGNIVESVDNSGNYIWNGSDNSIYKYSYDKNNKIDGIVRRFDLEKPQNVTWTISRPPMTFVEYIENHKYNDFAILEPNEEGWGILVCKHHFDDLSVGDVLTRDASYVKENEIYHLNIKNRIAKCPHNKLVEKHRKIYVIANKNGELERYTFVKDATDSNKAILAKINDDGTVTTSGLSLYFEEYICEDTENPENSFINIRKSPEELLGAKYVIYERLIGEQYSLFIKSKENADNFWIDDDKCNLIKMEKRNLVEAIRLQKQLSRLFLSEMNKTMYMICAITNYTRIYNTINNLKNEWQELHPIASSEDILAYQFNKLVDFKVNDFRFTNNAIYPEDKDLYGVFSYDYKYYNGQRHQYLNENSYALMKLSVPMTAKKVSYNHVSYINNSQLNLNVILPKNDSLDNPTANIHLGYYTYSYGIPNGDNIDTAYVQYSYVLIDPINSAKGIETFGIYPWNINKIVNTENKIETVPVSWAVSHEDLSGLTNYRDYDRINKYVDKDCDGWTNSLFIMGKVNSGEICECPAIESAYNYYPEEWVGSLKYTRHTYTYLSTYIYGIDENHKSFSKRKKENPKLVQTHVDSKLINPTTYAYSYMLNTYTYANSIRVGKIVKTVGYSYEQTFNKYSYINEFVTTYRLSYTKYVATQFSTIEYYDRLSGISYTQIDDYEETATKTTGYLKADNKYAFNNIDKWHENTYISFIAEDKDETNSKLENAIFTNNANFDVNSGINSKLVGAHISYTYSYLYDNSIEIGYGYSKNSENEDIEGVNITGDTSIEVQKNVRDFLNGVVPITYTVKYDYHNEKNPETGKNVLNLINYKIDNQLTFESEVKTQIEEHYDNIRFYLGSISQWQVVQDNVKEINKWLSYCNSYNVIIDNNIVATGYTYFAPDYLYDGSVDLDYPDKKIFWTSSEIDALSAWTMFLDKQSITLNQKLLGSYVRPFIKIEGKQQFVGPVPEHNNSNTSEETESSSEEGDPSWGIPVVGEELPGEWD